MKIFKGKVIAKKMAKTATVAVERVVVHPMYKKRFRRTKKFHVHDEKGVKIGDKVKFVASKPHSKLKKWEITEVSGKETKKKNSRNNNKASGPKGLRPGGKGAKK